jgi:hypothetical protein
MITILSVVFAFAGSFVYGGFGDEPNIEEELDDLEEAADKIGENILQLAEYLGVQNGEKIQKRG